MQEEEKKEVDLDINSALKTVLKRSQVNDGLVKGLNEVVRALDRKEAQLCVLAENCEEARYKKLITSLCKQNNIKMIEVEDRADLGEWLGQCKYDKQKKPRKVKGCSSVAIKDYGEESAALNYVVEYIKQHS